MQYWFVLLSLHIAFSGVWLVNFIIDPLFKNYINKVKSSPIENKLISLYLKTVNLLGMIGAVGILVTGIIMILVNPGYEFFQFTANHWLTTKQVITVIILILLGVRLIPTAKKIRLAISNDLNSPVEDKTEIHKNLKKLYSINFQMNILVILNFLLAVTRFLYS